MSEVIIPNFENSQVVDKNGNFTPAWQNIMQQLFTNLENHLSNEGLTIPQQTTANITALNTSKSIGALLYDSDTNQVKVNINGTFTVIA